MMQSRRPPVAMRSAALMAVAALLFTANLAVGQSPSPEPSIATSGFENLGPVTLKVWADSGEKDTFDKLLPRFQSKYPNVTVDVTFKAFNDYQATILNALSSNNAPDVAQGNQSYAGDGSMAEAGLIIPLDAYAKAYGWDTRFASTLSQFRWVPGAKAFGEGSLYGLAPDDQSVGLYYNKAKLAELGVEPPQTLDEFEAILAKAKDAGEVPIALGAADKQGPMRLWGLVQAAFTPAQEIRDLIMGVPGSTASSPTNIAAAQKLVDWANAGYFTEGFNGISEDDAVSRFVNGEGVFMFDGNWYVPTVEEGLGADAGYMSMPVGPSGAPAGSGSSGLGWHVSSKSQYPDLAAAFIAEILSTEFMPDLVSVGRIPAQPGAQITGGLLAESAAASEKVLAADGQTWYPDWGTLTMFDTLAAGLQELLGGRITAQQFTDKLQADWAGTWGG